MPEPMDDATMTAPDADAPAAGSAIWQNEAFRQHMHEHAEQLDELNFALADGKLEAAKTPAKWLADHDTEMDVQSDWLPHLYRMRTEAEAVQAAPDLATARAAAQRIVAQCQECHAAVGIDSP
ncbi:MAG: hypothetical protein ACR2Q3_12675 [Woeseiaceae bacterium]